MGPNKKVEKVKAQISDISVSDENVKMAVENLTGAFKKDRDEIISLLKEKRPTLFSNWSLEIASEYYI